LLDNPEILNRIEALLKENMKPTNDVEEIEEGLLVDEDGVVIED